MKRSPFALCVTALLSCFAGAIQAVYAEPAGFQLVSGSAELATPSQSSLIVRQHSQTVRLDWTGFSIDSGETVRFEQPSASALAVNRVTGDGASLINGELTANGRLFLINPNGILIGAGGGWMRLQGYRLRQAQLTAADRKSCRLFRGPHRRVIPPPDRKMPEQIIRGWVIPDRKTARSASPPYRAESVLRIAAANPCARCARRVYGVSQNPPQAPQPDPHSAWCCADRRDG